MNFSNEEIEMAYETMKNNNSKNSKKILDNSRKILEIINKNKGAISINKCPEEITLEMLRTEMGCSDLRLQENYDKNELWKSYCITCFTTSKFGLYSNSNPKAEINLNEILIPVEKNI
jgi:hypothetical protein